MDTFDSIFPTKNARHGHIFTRQGTINIKNARFKTDYTPLGDDCPCEVCRLHTKSYLQHLIKTREPLGLRLASYTVLWV